jgi:hypothetical protein
MKNGENFETICERISENDPLTPEVEDYIKNHLVLSRGIVKQNVHGFIEYLQKIHEIRYLK